MQKFIYSKAICLHVTTYENLNHKGEQLVGILQKIFNQMLQYPLAKMVIDIEKMNHRNLRYDFNEKNLKKLYELLLLGEVQHLSIGDYYKESGLDPYSEEIEIIHFPHLFSIGLSCNHAVTYPPHFSEKLIFHNDFSVSISDRLFDHNIPEDIQDFFVELFQDTIRELNGVTGYITYETTSAGGQMPTIFESIYYIQTNHPPGYKKRLRGYFWSNYLTKDHIETLGGLEHVMCESPCYAKEIIKSYDQTGVILQLTENINDYSDQQLLSLKNFFYPLLIKTPGEPLVKSFSFTEGYKIRLVD
jgi:hypothetical protein